MTPLFKLICVPPALGINSISMWKFTLGSGWRVDIGSGEPIHVDSGQGLIMELDIDENDVATFTVTRKGTPGRGIEI